jgi:prefoldin subunit 2
VLETLAPVPKDRKCFRLINGVLVERTVADVMPALQTNAEGLKSVLEGLVKEYKKKQQEMETWKVCGCLVPVSPSLTPTADFRLLCE